MSGNNDCFSPSHIFLTKDGRRIKGYGPVRDLAMAALSVGAMLDEYDQDGATLWITRYDEERETYSAYAERRQGWRYFNAFTHRTDVPAYVIASQSGVAPSLRSESGHRFTACLVVAVIDDYGEVLHVVVRPSVPAPKYDDVNDLCWEDLASSLQVGDVITLHPAPECCSLMLKSVSSQYHDIRTDGPRQSRALVQLTVRAVSSQDGNVLFDRNDYVPTGRQAGSQEPVAYPHVEFNIFRPLPEGVLEKLTAMTTDQPVEADAEQVHTAHAA